MLVRSRKAQSILEYALLIAVVVAAILIMQVFVKRGFQGSLKDSSDRMGEQFSATQSTSRQVTNLDGEQNIIDETATNASITGFLPAGSIRAAGDTGVVAGANSYSVNMRTGGTQNVTSASAIDDIGTEQFNFTDVGASVGDFAL